jgi:hypothetical protein
VHLAGLYSILSLMMHGAMNVKFVRVKPEAATAVVELLIWV